MVSNAIDIITRVVNPEKADLSPQTAREVLRWQFNDEDRQHVAELLEKNSGNVLSPDERAELQTYIVLGDLLNILHAQARLSLQQHSPAAD